MNSVPWNVYPRPQLKREHYVNLNGSWDFCAAGAGEQPVYDRQILVPYPVEAPLSGIGERFSEEKLLWYRRTFSWDRPREGRVLLHCGGVDQRGEVFLNGRPQGTLDALRDTVELTALHPGENLLELRVTDRLSDVTVPYGKQREARGGMWYTPVSGIWQTVWLERVPKRYITGLRMTPLKNGVEIRVEGVPSGILTCEGVDYPFAGSPVRIFPKEPRYWTPEDPYLYDFTVRAGEDRVESYFALRTLEIRTVEGLPRLCLNGKPLFFHGLLDQGWWPEGLWTPPDPGAYERDILAAKALGFNTLRKHIKVEPEQFYYDCDRLGMVVFQDMVNNGKYRFFHDTVLPTVGIQRLDDRHAHRNKAQRQRFLDQMEATVERLRNHPSVCYWTIFNEGWGQFDSDAVYDRLKALDPTRFIDAASGWFRRTRTDVESRHVYFKKFRVPKTNKPLVLSEFGGYSWRVPGHCFSEKNYGYRLFREREDFQAALLDLYETQILPAVPKGLCAAVYTQLSDVEEETNGLLTYDRQTEKPDRAEMAALGEKLKFSR